MFVTSTLRRLLISAISVFAGLVTGLVAQVSQATTVLEATYTTNIHNGWVKVERWRDTRSQFVQETFPWDGRGDQDGQRVRFFNQDATPHSSRYLLYYAPGWDTNTQPVPVLLVHGANQNADLAWANPNEAGPYGCGSYSCPQQGLMQSLSNDGFKVFATSMSHKNGDGYLWSEHIANAISRIRSMTGATTVDIVSWSKGAFNARMYVSSLIEPWGTLFRSDVRRLIMLGGPNGGVDSSFRHGTYSSVVIYPGCGGAINGPTAHDYINCYGVLWNGPEWTYSSSYYPGSRQMLKRWDHQYGLPTYEPDWWTTYHGGWGFYSHSKGIDDYLGDSLVETLQLASTSADVRVHNLCGDAADIALLHNEHTGPSDGVVFVDSCIDSTGITNHGGSVTLPLNHLELGYKNTAVNQVKTWLLAP